MKPKKLRALDPLVHKDLLDDLLYQKSEFVERCYQLVNAEVDPPFAISIDGLWGTGKTTVMRLLHDKFKLRNYPVTWFNPWEYSQTQDVVLAFLQSLAREYTWGLQKMEKSGGKILRVLLDVGMGVALKSLTGGAVALGDVKKSLEKEDVKYEQYQDMVQELKKEFRELINTVSGSERYQGKPVIIFFDDFDRCLPQDAIKLLETLKNMFVTEDCRAVFICGIDTRVAKNFIRDHYKVTDEFAINYFRKIFNLTISMPYHQDAALYALLRDYIASMFEWEGGQIDSLAKTISLRGIQAEMISVRKYLNVINNLRAFLAFTPEYELTPERDVVTLLLLVKEAWQPFYETLIREAIKDRAASLAELTNRLIQIDDDRQEPMLTPAQRGFLQDYFLSAESPFHQVKLGNDYLLRYPTLA